MKKGNTLIELILYIAIVSGIAMTSVMFVTDLVKGRVKSVLEENVAHNARLASRRLNYELRQATSITSATATDICLVSPTVGRNPTRIYLSSGRLYLGWGGSCASPTVTYPLTSSDVTITSLAFNDSSVGASHQLDYSFKVSGNNTVGRQEWIYDTTASGSASLR
ncbi:MAG: hypothetical protein WCG44_01685 [bacterium]